MDIRKLAPGDRILDYRILERIGEGGFGEVFRAEHEVLRRVVAIKVPRDQGSLAALRHEGVVQASLEHPNIVRTLELSISHDPPYVAMEYVRGSSLADVLKKEGPLPWRRATRVLLESAKALAYAHSRGVIHGDVKPGNILCEEARDGRVLLTDFGLGRVFEGPQGSLQISRSLELATSGAEVQGTIRYLAPELLRGERADERADVYSFGVLLFELLTGRLPEGREVPSDLVRDLPAELDRVFARAFTRRERRPATLDTTIDELRGLLERGRIPQPTAQPIVKAIPASPAPPGPATEPAAALVVRAVPALTDAGEPTLHLRATTTTGGSNGPALCGTALACVHDGHAAGSHASPTPGGNGTGHAPPPVDGIDPGATAEEPGALEDLAGRADPAFARWRETLLGRVREGMSACRGVGPSEAQGFDVSFGVTVEGEPHHRVYALVLPALDPASARTSVAAARRIFEREKGIWEKEVTFYLLAQTVREREQVLWTLKSFSMGWWRRRRVVLHDMESDRVYATELGCDPRGNPLKRAFLTAIQDAVRQTPIVAPEPVVERPAARRYSGRGMVWGAALAILMASGLLGSIMAVELAGRCTRTRNGQDVRSQNRAVRHGRDRVRDDVRDTTRRGPPLVVVTPDVRLPGPVLEVPPALFTLERSNLFGPGAAPDATHEAAQRAAERGAFTPDEPELDEVY